MSARTHRKDGTPRTSFYCMLHKKHHYKGSKTAYYCLKYGYDRETYEKRHTEYKDKN